MAVGALLREQSALAAASIAPVERGVVRHAPPARPHGCREASWRLPTSGHRKPRRLLARAHGALDRGRQAGVGPVAGEQEVAPAASRRRAVRRSWPASAAKVARCSLTIRPAAAGSPAGPARARYRPRTGRRAPRVGWSASASAALTVRPTSWSRTNSHSRGAADQARAAASPPAARRPRRWKWPLTIAWLRLGHRRSPAAARRSAAGGSARMTWSRASSSTWCWPKSRPEARPSATADGAQPLAEGDLDARPRRAGERRIDRGSRPGWCGRSAAGSRRRRGRRLSRRAAQQQPGRALPRAGC